MSRRLRVAFLIVMSLSVHACKSPSLRRDASTIEELKGIPIAKNERVVDIKIAALDELGVSYEVRQFVRDKKKILAGQDGILTPDGIRDHVVRMTRILIKPPLSEAKFARLKDVFGGQSQVPYRAKPSYDLVDFLPPVMQALNFKLFQEEDVGNATIESNCWSTAYEIARGGSRFHIFGATQGTLIWPLLSDPRFSIEIPNDPRDSGVSAQLEEAFGRVVEYRKGRLAEYPNKLPAVQSYPELVSLLFPPELRQQIITGQDPDIDFSRNDQLRFGDVLLVLQEGTVELGDGNATLRERSLAHAAVFVAPGLYFEKTFLNDFTAYRLVTFSDIQSEYGDLLRSGTRYVHRRFHRSPPLPPPREAFAGNVSVFADYDLLTDSEGRGILGRLK